MSNKTFPFGPMFVTACDALSLQPEAIALCIVKNIPRTEALAVKDGDDVVRLIAKALGLHVENALKRNAEQGIVAPSIDAAQDVNEMYDAYEADQAAKTRTIDVAQYVPGTGTLQ